MELELHVAGDGNTLTAGVRDIDYDYQAEQWVLDTYGDPKARKVVRWVLIDDAGERCVWERKDGDPGCPRITIRSERFTSQWADDPVAVEG